jgi:ABC-type multidrug transport system ATPase subunit
MTAHAIRIRGLKKSFGSVHALGGLDLDVPSGGIFGVVGPNGAGKTTLFSVISGYLPADSGSVELDGQVVSPGTPPPAGRFAILPQDASFIDGMDLGPQLVFYGELQGLSLELARSEARRVLELVGLPEVFGRRARTLSHGMHKRVGIAQAFIGNPAVVILDEPTAGLDPHAAREVRGILRRITGGRTVVVSSHNLTEIEDLCTEVAILHQGMLVRQDTIAGVIGQADLVVFRLGRPPSSEELGCLEALPFVESATWAEGDDRVRVRFDPALQPAGPAARDMVAKLVDAGVPFVEMQVGKSLEERFIEETA